MKKIILLLIVTVLLAGCGFHLRNQNELPPQLKNVYLQSGKPYGQLELALKTTLKSVGITLADSPQEAPITIDIAKSELTHDNPNVVSSDQATIYNFTANCSFNIIDNKTKAKIINTQNISFTRQLTLQPNEILETSSEVNTLEQEMHREMVFKILNILNATNTKNALAALSK